MTKRLLTCLFALCTFSLTVFAEEETPTYTGTATITPNDGEVTTMEDYQFGLVEEEDGTYTLVFNGPFYIGGTSYPNIAPFTIDEISVSENEGTITSTNEPEYINPGIRDIGAITIKLKAMSIDSAGDMILNLEYEISERGEPTGSGTISFITNGKGTTSVAEINSSAFSIYVSSESTIELSQEANSYIIFNTAGSIVQSGVAEQRTINIANLNAGIYLLKVNNNIAKFIKK